MRRALGDVQGLAVEVKLYRLLVVFARLPILLPSSDLDGPPGTLSHHLAASQTQRFQKFSTLNSIKQMQRRQRVGRKNNRR